MTGGAGFTKDGLERSRLNRAQLKKKAPFQRLKENLFGKNAPAINIDVDESVLDDLQKIKEERRAEERLRRRFFTIFLFVILIVVFFLLFGRYL